MRTIDEIRERLLLFTVFVSDLEKRELLINLTYELIDAVATLQREKCAQEAKLLIDNDYELNVYVDYHEYKITVAKESILNAKL